MILILLVEVCQSLAKNNCIISNAYKLLATHWATLKCSLASVLISLLTQGLELTYKLGAKCQLDHWIQLSLEAMICLLSLNDSNKLFSSITIQKSFKTLTPRWKPVLEVDVITYGFISAFLSVSLYEEYWENPWNRFLLALLT